jgi:hypothetical protein
VNNYSFAHRKLLANVFGLCNLENESGTSGSLDICIFAELDVFCTDHPHRHTRPLETWFNQIRTTATLLIKKPFSHQVGILIFEKLLEYFLDLCRHFGH